MSFVNRALSREGHAAMSMRGETDRWIMIQKNTFTNWVNEQLRTGGSSRLVEDLQTAFEDGVLLCGLIESLQGKKIGRVIKKPLNHHQNLENCTLALTAIANDNVRLVNIGSDDISNGNLKLILGLIWHLILRYQIGKTKFPAKKLMLAWLKAVIPECNITNFTTCWNDGVALHALINYCNPNIEEASNWRYLSHSDSLNNCSNAMNLAKKHFDIPLVVRPEDLSSPDLDELSGMTYLSYFMKIDSPGYMATRGMVRNLLKSGNFNNFTDDWADGRLLCNLVTSLGESASPIGSSVENLQLGIDAARRLGVEPILTSKEMCDPEVDHIGIMAYAAYFSNFKPVRTAAEKVVMEAGPRNVFIDQEADFSLRIDDPELKLSDVRAEIKGPDSNPTVYFNWVGSRATGTFTPTETGHHRLNVYCENSLIVGCPVSFKVIADRSRVRYIGPDRCSAGLISELKVDVTSAGQGDIQCEARAPNGRTQNLSAVYRNGNYVMHFTPSEVGIWQVSVLYDGEHISDSPFNVTVFDPSRIRVYGLEGGAVGTGLKFHADTSEAGTGEITVQVSCNGSHVPSYIHQDRVGLYSIDFTPEGAGTYRVEVYFNDIEVRGSPFTLEIVDSGQVTVSGDGLSLVPVNRTASFVVDTQGSGSGNVDVEIMAPNGSTVPFNIVQGSGQQTIEYVPEEVGDHRIDLKYMGNEVDGSPFTAKAYDTSAIVITPLRNGLVGSSFDFTIDVSRAGEGQLEIMVNNGNLPNTVELERPSVYRIAFTPTSAGKQYVDINFNSESLPGSPFSCLANDGAGVTLTGMDNVIPANRSTDFNIQCDSDDVTPEVEVSSPNGIGIPARLVSQSGGNFRVEWTPTTPGRHRVEVQFAGRQIEGSPFFVDVFDLLSIRVNNFQQGDVGEQASFDVDLADAGSLESSIRVVSPSGRTVNCSVGGDYLKSVTYIPDETGPHNVFITYAGFELPGCPFIQNIDEGGLPTADGDGLFRGEEDNVATFYVDVGKKRGELGVQVDGPNSIAKTTIEPSGDHYVCTYTPVEVGIFTLQLQWNGKNIPGSPFHPKIVDPRKVKIYGGWQQLMDSQERVKLIVGEEKRLVFDVSQAGPGIMKAEVQGPSSSLPVIVDSHTVGQNVICFTPEEEGNHYIHLFWAERTLPNSPFIGYAVRVSADANKVILTGRGLKEAKVREEAEFVIDGSQAGSGVPEVTLSGVRAEISNRVVPLGNGRFHCTYTPVIPGAYLLHITWNGRQLKGSPYKVNVIGAFFPHKVSVTGEGLKGGVMGKTSDVLIDVRKAGPGELTAACMGPSKVANVELHDNRDGTFHLAIKPMEVGRHVLQVKYGGEHVLGSPFILKVGSQPDASKVRVTGPGVEHGILATFQSSFVVETRGAGAGQLTVRIRGPKGGFQVEMYRDSQRDRTILCRYDPTETGLYIISIRWSGVDVPGSPFQINIVDTQQELERLLQEQSYSSSAATPRTYAQWKAEI